jgi:hypothetical protein
MAKQGLELFDDENGQEQRPDPKDAYGPEPEATATPKPEPVIPDTPQKPKPSPDSPHEAQSPSEPPLIGGIDLNSIALDDDYADGMDADETGAAAIPVGKPQRDWFFRTHPTAWKNIRLLEVKSGADRGYYLVDRSLWKLCQAEDIPLRPVRLTLAIARDAGSFLWPLKLQERGFENRKDDWSASALRICKIAEVGWVKLYTKPGGNCYSHKVADGIEAEPVWPLQSFEELIGLAFEGKVIKDKNDPLLRRVMGKE